MQADEALGYEFLLLCGNEMEYLLCRECTRRLNCGRTVLVSAITYKLL